MQVSIEVVARLDPEDAALAAGVGRLHHGGKPDRVERGVRLVNRPNGCVARLPLPEWSWLFLRSLLRRGAENERRLDVMGNDFDQRTERRFQTVEGWRDALDIGNCQACGLGHLLPVFHRRNISLTLSLPTARRRIVSATAREAGQQKESGDDQHEVKDWHELHLHTGPRMTIAATKLQNTIVTEL